MNQENDQKLRSKSFFGVAMFMILIGAFLFTVGIVAWIINCYTDSTVVTMPSIKAAAGLIVIGQGYMILILEAIRKK